jgi:hypothetical protein
MVEPCCRTNGPWFEAQGHKLSRYRVAIGFPSIGKRGKWIGECWDGRASADGTFEVLIRPDQAILARELVHAAVGVSCGHKGAFRTVARRRRFLARCPILEGIGPFPCRARLWWVTRFQPTVASALDPADELPAAVAKYLGLVGRGGLFGH